MPSCDGGDSYFKEAVKLAGDSASDIRVCPSSRDKVKANKVKVGGVAV